MKKTLTTTLMTLLLCVCMVFGLAGCGTSQEDIDNAINPVTEQITTINATLTEMQTLDTTLDGYIDALESKVATLETDLTAVNATLEGLEENSATKTALLETKTALESEINTIKADITALKAKDTELDGKITELETALSTEITDTEKWIEETFATKAACDTLKTEINTRIAELQTKMNGLEDSIDNLETTVNGLQQDIDDLNNRIDDLEIRINCLEGKHVLEYADNGNGTHSPACAYCNYVDTATIENHTEKYVDNGDGTHSPACAICDYVDTATTEEHHMYVDENCICSLCGVQHYLESADLGDCTCVYCWEDIHDLDENCVCKVCSLLLHPVNSTTGICSVCNAFTATASIRVEGEKTYYATFNEAAAYANGKDDIVIVFENAGFIGDAFKFESGKITIDLNGKVIDSSIELRGTATVTICDSVGGGETLQRIGVWGGTLMIEGGKHEYVSTPSNLVITDGEFAVVGIGAGDNVTISGGSFEEIAIDRNGPTFADILADGYCFYDSDGNVVDISNVESGYNGGYYYFLYNVTVGKIQ